MTNKDKAISIIGISLDLPDKTTEYATANELNIPLYYPYDDKVFKERNRIIGTPTTLFINANGIVEKVSIGVLSEDDISQFLARVSGF